MDTGGLATEGEEALGIGWGGAADEFELAEEGGEYAFEFSVAALGFF
ncbi:MAG: hypothetical protein RI897_4114 [Verrucomicrobiota bacterium]